jgi:N utilization substance protein A
LAARLTGWRIDIKSETQLAEEEAGYGDQEWAEGEWVEDESGEMVWKPAEGGEAMSAEEWSHQAEDTSDSAAAASSPAAEAAPAVEAPASESGAPDGAVPAEAPPVVETVVTAEVTADVSEEAEA